MPAKRDSIRLPDGAVIHRVMRGPSLEEAQALLGGYVELVELDDGSQLLCNEEGKLLGMKRNVEASNLAGVDIHGPAFLLRGGARWV